MIASMVVVIDEPVDAGFKIARQVIIFQQDAVFERLMPAFDLALRLRMVGCAANVRHFLSFQPFSQISRHVAGTIVAKQTWLMDDPSLVTARGRNSKI